MPVKKRQPKTFADTKGRKATKTLKNRPRKLMFTAHQMRNFIMNNSLQDWLELYHDDRDKMAKREHKRMHRSSPGDRFREHVFQYVQSCYPEHVVVLVRPDIREMTGEEAASVLNGKETIEHMRKKVPIIINAQLINRYSGNCDIADMLVRIDFLSQLFPNYVPPDDVSSDPHNNYVAVGVRHGKLVYCVDMVTVRNTSSIKYWKSKLLMQNSILSRYQQYDPCHAIILGSGSSWTGSDKKVHHSAEFSLGVVHFNGKDLKTSVDGYVGAELWLCKLHDAGAAKWKVEPVPSVPELYANAKMTVYDTPWASTISDIAIKQDEITQLWNCSVNVRNRAHAKGIKRLSDAKSSTDLGFKAETRTSSMIDRYLAHEYDDVQDIPLNICDTWTTLDFECSSAARVRTYDRTCFTDSCIYLVSIGDRQFGISDEVQSLEEVEKNVAKGVYQTLLEIESTVGPRDQYQIFCWGQAEARYMWQLERKYPEYPIATKFAANLVDLHELFVENEIILSGQMNNTLSSVAKALGVSQKVPVNTNELAEIVLSDQVEPERAEALRTLLEYNLNDVKVLEEIIRKIVYEQQGSRKEVNISVEEGIKG